MWSAAASAILEGMPEAADLRVLRSDGVTWVFAGKSALFRFADGDAAMRNIAVAALRQIGFGGTQVAAALGLTTNYVATLHQRALRDGTAGLVRPRGRPRTVTGQGWEQARAWRAAGVRDAEIARRLEVQQSTVLRRLGPAQVQGELALEEAAAAGGPAAGREDQPQRPEPQAAAGREEQKPVPPALVPRPEPGVVPPGFGGSPGPAEGSGVFSRYAGAMLLHAYPGRAGEILLDAGGEAREAVLLSAVSSCELVKSFV
jgi:transposase